MKVSTAQFMRECVAQTSIYIGTFRTALDDGDLAQKLTGTYCQRRNGVKPSRKAMALTLSARTANIADSIARTLALKSTILTDTTSTVLRALIQPL
jgi:hypothetical protein